MKKKTFVTAVIVVLAAGAWLCYEFGPSLLERSVFERTPIKVGILHSLSGTMAISETSVVDATLLAIEEINQSGGLLGSTDRTHCRGRTLRLAHVRQGGRPTHCGGESRRGFRLLDFSQPQDR